MKIATDDYASVLLRFENNLRGVMTVSQVSAGRKAFLEFEINGSEGSLAWNSGYPDTFVQLFKDFYSYIEAGAHSVPPSFPTFQTGHEELLLCEAISVSAHERRWLPGRLG